MMKQQTIIVQLGKTVSLVAMCGLVALAGCGEQSSPQFKLNLPALELAPTPILPEQRQDISNALMAMFGTPDNPFVLEESGLDLKKIQVAAGPVWSDKDGTQRGLYRQHCVHCHGTTGDGMGPTASILNPYPRDYRPGIYKYKSTSRSAMPTHADLERILRHGVMGTAMPSFDLLAPTEIDSLIEYVKYLSLRGQVEIKLIAATADLGEGERLTMDRATLVDDLLATEAEKWTTAGEQLIDPPPMPDVPEAEAIALGREAFYSEKKGNCVKCHGPAALGDGQTTDWDDWNKPLGEQVKALTESRAALAKLQQDRTAASGDALAGIDEQIKASQESIANLQKLVGLLESQMLPLRTIQPRNLRLGIYRFGRRPLDLFRRVHEGIYGTPMPGGGLTPGFTPDEMWNVVRYLRSLPYESINRVQPDPKVAGSGPY
jgi:mono/diheme cytochrome c family protein